MATNPKKHYITARYDQAVDGDGTGGYPRTITLAQTMTLPDNAIVNEVCLFCSAALSGTSTTFAVNAGGVNVTAAVPEANMTLAAVVPADLVDAGGKATSAAEIKAVIGAAVLTAGAVDITVGYFIGTV